MYSIAYTMDQALSYGLPKFRNPGHILVVAVPTRLHMAGETFLTDFCFFLVIKTSYKTAWVAAYCVLFIDHMEILITHIVSGNSSKGKRLPCLSNCFHFHNVYTIHCRLQVFAHILCQILSTMSLFRKRKQYSLQLTMYRNIYEKMLKEQKGLPTYQK